MQRTIALLTAAVVALWTNGTRAADQPLDHSFVIKTSSCEHAVIEMAKMAQKHGDSAKVKEFAGRLEKDHQGCYDKLSEVIKNRKIVVVAGFEKDAKADMDRIGKLQGAEFDREFLKWTIAHHKDAVARFEAQKSKGKEEELCTFAKDTLPGLRAYLKEAQDLAKATN